MATIERPRGVQLRSDDGTRSSQQVGRSAFSDAVSAIDADLARRILATSNWRKAYLGPVRDVVVTGTRSAKNALRSASDGLASVHRQLTFHTHDEEIPLRDALVEPSGGLSSGTISGEGKTDPELVVPYRDRTLRGDDLRRQIDDWRDGGVIEPSCARALEAVIANPDWLALDDLRFVLLGAASQMGPTEHLLSWGAEVAAVDLPVPQLWERLFDIARRGRGRMTIPLRGRGGEVHETRAGANLLTELPAVAEWISELQAPYTIGNYVYADGTDFVRLAGAADALIDHLATDDRGISLAYLATPTDAFAVPQDVVDRALSRRNDRALSSMLSAVSARRLYSPNYQDTIPDEDGRTWGVSDCLVPIQGPNYALAKCLQRWRAVVALEDDVTISANVAPATRTRSVIKNKMLAAAYAGAPAYGVEIFEPDTSRVLMAALLVHDLRTADPGGNRPEHASHPFELFATGAAHGGIWTLPYEPRTVLPLALARGFVARR